MAILEPVPTPQASSSLPHRFHTMPWVDYYAAALHIPMSDVWSFQATTRHASLTHSPSPEPRQPGHPPPPHGAAAAPRDPHLWSSVGAAWRTPHLHGTSPPGVPDFRSPPSDLYLAPSRGGPRHPSAPVADEAALVPWQRGMTEVTQRRDYLFGAWVFMRYHNAAAETGRREGLAFGKRWARFYATSGAEGVTAKEFEQVWRRRAAYREVTGCVWVELSQVRGSGLAVGD